MTLKGKGFMIWQIYRCEGGNPDAIASRAQEAGLTNVLIKIADANYAVNLDRTTGKDLVPAVTQALHNKGIQVWGWHYVYGSNPSGEAQIAIRRVKELGLEGYIIDAEVEFKQPGREEAARRYMGELRAALPNLPIALSSFRFPSYHPQFPWKVFLENCDLNMPQVYWQDAHNAGAQLQRSVREFQAMIPFRPIIPTGPVYKVGDWSPTPADIHEYLDTCRSLNLESTNFFEWYYGRTILTSLWDTIASYPWPAYGISSDIVDQYISALNNHQAKQVSSFFAPTGVHITSAQSVQGTDAIQAWYTNFFDKIIPGAIFTLTGSSGNGSSRHFTWQASSPTKKILDGNDTIGLVDGKITYHYSFYSFGT